ncbi:MAG: TlpA family protein disulfide reductase [Pyrinomonadaceae bacterium]|nr:TlpA family protein disulfide reductase [Pyrinomonadaceae bacterium]
MRTKTSNWVIFAFACLFVAVPVCAVEYTGQFETGLIANTEDSEQVVLKLVPREKIKGTLEVAEDAHLAAARLMDPRTKNFTIIALLVEERGETPVLYVDIDGDNTLSKEEKFTLKQSEPNNPYLWEMTAELKMKDGFFKVCPVFIQYFKSVKMDKMGPEDRLVTQSTEVMAQGAVDIKGKKVLFQYAYLADKNKVDPQAGLLGVDMDGDGKVDLGKMAAESTKAKEETIVFRVGDTYLATKKADVAKNQIVVVEREAKDYKRLEVHINKEFPDFSFTDFEGKKRKFSEFRGKYVLLDIWGFWCGPCRRELPYIREAHRRFGARNLVIVGLNTDEDYTVDSMKKGLSDAGMTWTNAQFSSVADFLRVGLRVNSFPTTFLISPEGKVLSISRTDRDELSLRGASLLESLDKVITDF